MSVYHVNLYIRRYKCRKYIYNRQLTSVRLYLSFSLSSFLYGKSFLNEVKRHKRARGGGGGGGGGGGDVVWLVIRRRIKLSKVRKKQIRWIGRQQRRGENKVGNNNTQRIMEEGKGNGKMTCV